MNTIALNPFNIGRADIGAASSLININERIFVCCDDQYGLFELNSENGWIQRNWTQAPVLPDDHQERKKIKPDFESLVCSAHDKNKILLIASGSKKNRTQVLSFDLVTNQFSPVDMSELYKNLFNILPLINIEGAAIVGENYLFLNRGIKANVSSIISVDVNSLEIQSVTEIDFGSIGETNLHGSELCLFGDSLYAVAVAEASDNSYDDGEILGSSFIRICPKTLNILEQWQFDRPIKVEGLCRFQNKWLVATDPDGVGQSEFFTFS